MADTSETPATRPELVAASDVVDAPEVEQVIEELPGAEDEAAPEASAPETASALADQRTASDKRHPAPPAAAPPIVAEEPDPPTELAADPEAPDALAAPAAVAEGGDAPPEAGIETDEPDTVDLPLEAEASAASLATEIAVGAEVALPKHPDGPRFAFHSERETSVQPSMTSAPGAVGPLDAGSPASGTRPVYATTFLPASVPPSTAELSMPSSTNEVRDFIRRAAIERGMDPDVAVRVALSEGGLTPVTWTGDHASSFGPFQLHYGAIAAGGNAVSGLGDAFTSETGLRADDQRTWRQQVEWALDRAARSGWTPWHGAARAGINAFDGLPQAGGYGLQSANLHRRVDVPNQFAAQLSAPEAYAACGPVAAVAVARWLGRNPTVAEAVETAKRTGWTVAGGMNGIANEKRLLDAMRVSAHLETTVDWRHVQRDASNGNPVIVSTPQHYWVIDDFDPRTNTYHVGRSGLAFRSGREWMSAAEIQQLGGPPNGALYVDNPLAAPSPAASHADSPLAAPPSSAASTAVSDVIFDRWWEAQRA